MVYVLWMSPERGLIITFSILALFQFFVSILPSQLSVSGLALHYLDIVQVFQSFCQFLSKFYFAVKGSVAPCYRTKLLIQFCFVSLFGEN